MDPRAGIHEQYPRMGSQGSYSGSVLAGERAQTCRETSPGTAFITSEGKLLVTPTRDWRIPIWFGTAIQSSSPRPMVGQCLGIRVAHSKGSNPRATKRQNSAPPSSGACTGANAAMTPTSRGGTTSGMIPPPIYTQLGQTCRTPGRQRPGSQRYPQLAPPRAKNDSGRFKGFTQHNNSVS